MRRFPQSFFESGVFIVPSKYIPRRINLFDVHDSMTVVDYGCGSGRYTLFFSEKVGMSGNVYAVDIVPEIIKKIEKMVCRKKMTNVIPVLANGYHSGLQSGMADRIFAIDIFHLIRDVALFLFELRRIIKEDGVLYIDYGHQPKEQALALIREANIFQISEVHSYLPLGNMRA